MHRKKSKKNILAIIVADSGVNMGGMFFSFLFLINFSLNCFQCFLQLMQMVKMLQMMH